MSATAAALLGFAGWTLLLLSLLAVYRTSFVMSGARAANSFNASGDDVGGFGQRLTRAHANCFENLPIAGVILLYAIATGQEALTNGLALIFIGARIAQSVVHIISTSRFFVTLRFVLFLIQVGVLVYWLLLLAGLR